MSTSDLDMTLALISSGAVPASSVLSISGPASAPAPTASSMDILAQLKKSEKVGIQKSQGLATIKRDINELTDTKEKLARQIDVNNQHSAIVEAVHLDKADELDALQISVTAARESIDMMEKKEETIARQRIDRLREMSQVISAMSN